MTVSSARRLFLGISLPQTIIRPLTQIYSEHTHLSGLKWVKEDLLHMTVYFFGDIPEEMLENLINLIRLGLTDQVTFQLSFDRYCFAPSGKEARMIWARYHKQEEFRALATGLHELFLHIKPAQQFRKSPIPHITLARLRGFAQYDAIAFPLEPLADLSIDQLILWESHLSPTGPTYEEIQRFLLPRP